MKSGRIDLHVHTTASDGTLSPAGVVREALSRGVTILAIADHDITDGVRPAEEAARSTDITVIPAVELSVGSGEREIHVLGYFLDVTTPALADALADLRDARDERNERILLRLKELGAPLDPARVQEIAGSGSVGRPHIAKALVAAAHVSSEGEAFGRYLARGKPAYVGRQRLGLSQAAGLIREARGIPVLAHPAKIGSRTAIESTLAQGMHGLEVFHSDHGQADVDLLLAIARQKNLMVTGGTDSHGPHSDRALAVGAVDIPQWVGEHVLQHAPPWWRERP